MLIFTNEGSGPLKPFGLGLLRNYFIYKTVTFVGNLPYILLFLLHSPANTLLYCHWCRLRHCGCISLL